MQLTISTDQRIINSLLLNASFIDNLGLMHGKMGISICFFHLARQTGNQIYEDYAGELIDEIYDEITSNIPVNFENGLAGIGWGIEYLLQNGFIEADTDEVLEEFDNRIFKELIYNTPHDVGLLSGLVGIGAYFLKRVQNHDSNDEKISTLTNKQTLIHLIDQLERQTQNITKIISEPHSGRSPSDKPSNNSQTFKQSNYNPITNPESAAIRDNKPLPITTGTTNELFDLTWNYPSLLWFLSEIYQQNIFNFKVEKIIQRLTEPLSNESNLPKYHSNRLLLALALTKLQKNNSGQPTTNDEPKTSNSVRRGIQKHGEMNSPGRTNPDSKANQDNEQQTTNNIKSSNYSTQVELLNFSNIENRISNLLSGINRNTINSELPQNNFTLKYGTSGIEWIYNQLHQLTGDEFYKEEVEFWQKLTPSFEDADAFISIEQQKPDLSLGILEGLAGIWNKTLFQK